MANVVLVVDMVRGFCEEGHPLYVGESIRRIIEPIRRLLAEERSRGSSIIFLCDNHAPDEPSSRCSRLTASAAPKRRRSSPS